MIYTTGYTGKKPDDLVALAERLDAIVVDIRYYTTSRVPHWRGENLQGLLGDRYKWLQHFGNAGYREGTIRLSNVELGLAAVKSLLSTGKSLVLMCACDDFNVCHRKEVARELHECGLETTELTTWRAQEQPSLFAAAWRLPAGAPR